MYKAKTLQDIKDDPRVQSVYQTEGWHHFELNPGFQVDGNQQHHWAERTVAQLCEVLNNNVTEWKNDPALEKETKTAELIEDTQFRNGPMYEKGTEFKIIKGGPNDGWVVVESPTNPDYKFSIPLSKLKFESVVNTLPPPPTENLQSETDIHGRVETMLRDAQKNKDFKDSDIRVGGAKKEMAAIRKILNFGLKELSENEEKFGDIAMIKAIKKDKVFQKFDVKEQMDMGVSSGATFLKMKLRESFPSAPQINSKEARKIYVGFANLLYDTFFPVATVAGFKAKIEALFSNSSIKRDVCKFLFADDYTEIALRILPLITDQYRSEFIDFEDAYAYLDEVCSTSLDHNRNELKTCEKELRDTYGFSTQFISDNFIKTIHSGKNVMEIIEKIPFDIPAYVDKQQATHQAILDVFYLVTRLIDAFQKVAAILSVQKYPDYDFYNSAFQNPFWTFAIARLPELRDKYKRPFKPNESGIYFIQCFFSSRFRNFTCYFYNEESLILAKQYERVSEEQSLVNFNACADTANRTLEREQKEYNLATSARSIGDFDKLIKEGKVSRYGFYMEFHSRFGGNRRDHAYWEKLTDNGDKQLWIDKFIVHCEKAIKEATEKIEKCREKNLPHPDDWSWASEYLGEAIITAKGEEIKPEKRKAHSKPMLDYIERIGGLKIDKSKIRDIEHIKKFMTQYFGFRAYEFGQSLKDTEAAEIIFHFLGAISDFAEILNIDFAGINSKMGLSMGFASRGSGSASAHYEALGRIINLTKSNGDGSVAHEMAHYLDNIIPAFDNIDDYSFKKWATAQKDDRRGIKADLKNYYVKDAMQQIMAYILYGKKRISLNGSVSYDSGSGSMVEYVAKAESVPSGWTWRGYMPRVEDIDDLPKLIAKQYGYNRYAHFEDLTTRDLKFFDIYIRDRGIMEHTFLIPSKMSIYYRDSKNVGGDYWVRPWELFARAFEVYVSDKLAAANRFNNFLCHGEYQSNSVSYVPSYPYPQFNERKYLFGLFENLIAELKKQYGIGDFVPFTTELNGYTKVDIELSENAETKEQKQYLKRLKILKLMLSSEIKSMAFAEFTLKYKIGDAYVRIKDAHGEKSYLKSVSPTKIVLEDKAGNSFSLSPNDFVSKYTPESRTLGTGGDFKEILGSISTGQKWKGNTYNAEFYTHFLKVYDEYEIWLKAEEKLDLEARMRQGYSRVYAGHQPIDQLEDNLTKLYSYPNWEKQLQKIDSIAFETNRAQSLRELKEEILLKIADKIIECYDMAAPSNNDIFTLQLAIDAVNSVQSKLKFNNYWKHEYIQKILRDRAEFAGKKSESKIQDAAQEAQKIIADIFDEIQINTSTLDDLITLGNEFEAHKEFGFNKVMISLHGSEYHAEKVETIKFGNKKSTAEIRMCQDPNGKYYYGVNYNYHNGSSSYGCWLKKENSKTTKQECYNDFYIETALYNRYWPENEYKKILKEIKEQLNISEATVRHAEDLVENKIAKEKAKADEEAAAQQNAINEVKKFVNIGDTLWLNGRWDEHGEAKSEFIIEKFEGAEFIGDWWAQENHPQIKWPDFVVEIRCEKKNVQKGEYNNHLLYLAVIDGTLRQADYDGTPDNNHPFSEPLKIEREFQKPCSDGEKKIQKFDREKFKKFIENNHHLLPHQSFLTREQQNQFKNDWQSNNMEKWFSEFAAKIDKAHYPLHPPTAYLLYDIATPEQALEFNTDFDKNKHRLPTKFSLSHNQMAKMISDWKNGNIEKWYTSLF